MFTSRDLFKYVLLAVNIPVEDYSNFAHFILDLQFSISVRVYILVHADLFRLFLTGNRSSNSCNQPMVLETIVCWIITGELN